ncbi:MAG: hypothetical protein ACO3JS_10780, partial [Steroidobacteraceae bacterium]
MSMRGYQGVLPRTPSLEDESYLGFMESLRNQNILQFFPKIAAFAHEPNAEGDPRVRLWKRLMRSQQQQTWEKLQQSFDSQRAAYEDELAAG